VLRLEHIRRGDGRYEIRVRQGSMRLTLTQLRFLAGLSTLAQLIGIFLEETYWPLISAKLASNKGDHDSGRSSMMTGGLRAVVSRALLRPFALFLREPILQALGLFHAIWYVIHYILVLTNNRNR
jgi:hypothetical protein